MTTPLITTTVISSLLLAVWATVTAVRAKPISRAQQAGTGVVQLTITVMSVVSIAQMVQGQGPAGDTITFVGYLATVFLLLPAGWLWARAEPGRWGSGVLAVVAVVVPVLMARLDQVWTGVGPGGVGAP